MYGHYVRVETEMMHHESVVLYDRCQRYDFIYLVCNHEFDFPHGLSHIYLACTALQLTYNRWLASKAHRLDMAVGLMNNIGMCWNASRMLALIC